MDAGLFGEHLLQTLIHAWRSLLLPPHPHISTIYDSTDCKLPQKHGIVIPFSASLWAVPIECAYIAWKNFIRVNRYGKLDLTKVVLYAEKDEPYDTENLQNLKEFKILTKPLKIKKIDFNNPSQLEDYFNGRYDSDVVNFACPSKRVDAVAVWFDIHLDEDITLSSSPFHSDAKTCCWDQAVFPIQSSCTGDLELKFKCKDGKLSVEECVAVKNDEDPDTLANRLQSSLGEGNSLHKSKYPVSTDMIQFLNNKTLCERLNTVSISLEVVKKKNRFVLDLSPFPLLGLNFITTSQTRVVSVLKSVNDIKAVRELVRRNNINVDKLECVLEDSLEEFLINKGYQFDLIVNNLVEMSGELKEKSIAMLPRLK